MSSLLHAGLFRLAHRLRGSTSLARLAEIRSNLSLDPAAADALQLKLLRDLLAHAEQHVPYYRDLFATIGLRAADIRSLRDFARVPVLTKAIVREQGDAMRSRLHPIDTLTRLNSGGSTGVPLSFLHDARYLAYSDAGTYRALEQCGWTPGEMIAFVWGWNTRLEAMRSWEYELRQWLRRSYQLDPFQSDRASMHAWVRRWRRVRPSVAYGYASTLGRFATFLLEEGISLSPLRGAFVTAEKLLPEHRSAMEQAFQCRVFNCYGSSEVRNLAQECSLGRMHVNGDFGVIENDASDDTAPVAPFIVTSLRSYGMPFIRYRNEDAGRTLEERCSCGNGFPLIDLTIARVADHFTLPGGRIVHGEYFTHLMYGAKGIDLFQFHQTAPGAITLWIVPTPGQEAARKETLARVVRELAQVGTVPLQVQVREVDAIPLSSAGKHRFTRSDVPMETA